MEVCIRRAKPGDEETLAMIQIKSWQSAFADILDRETLEGCTDFERVTATYRRLLEQGVPCPCGRQPRLSAHRRREAALHCVVGQKPHTADGRVCRADLYSQPARPLAAGLWQQDDGAGAVGHGSRRIPAGDAVGVCREHPCQKIL